MFYFYIIQYIIKEALLKWCTHLIDRDVSRSIFAGFEFILTVR